MFWKIDCCFIKNFHEGGGLLFPTLGAPMAMDV